MISVADTSPSAAMIILSEGAAGSTTGIVSPIGASPVGSSEEVSRSADENTGSPPSSTSFLTEKALSAPNVLPVAIGEETSSARTSWKNATSWPSLE